MRMITNSVALDKLAREIAEYSDQCGRFENASSKDIIAILKKHKEAFDDRETPEFLAMKAENERLKA